MRAAVTAFSIPNFSQRDLLQQLAFEVQPAGFLYSKWNDSPHASTKN